MIFNLFKVSYHPEYNNLRWEIMLDVNGHENNIQNLAEAQQYFSRYILNWDTMEIRRKENDNHDPDNILDKDDIEVNLGYFITANIDILADAPTKETLKDK
jgi:hypothetical protein